MQPTYRFFSFTFAAVSALLLITSCDETLIEDDVYSDDYALHQRSAIKPPRQMFPLGTLWGRCDLTDVADPDWWGCNGSLGEGLACLRPVSDNGLNICVPQTWDPAYDDDCGNVYAPFGDGVSADGKTYCVVKCVDDSGCAPGMGCSPASHICAWVGE